MPSPPPSPRQRTIRGMTEAAKEAVKTAARELRDGYGGSAADTYVMTFSVQRADDRTSGGILAWIPTDTFALRGSYNSLSEPEQEARVEWERVHRSEAPWWHTKEQPSAPTPTSSSLPISDADLLLALHQGGELPSAVPSAAVPSAARMPVQIATPVSWQAPAGRETGSFLLTALTETSEPPTKLLASKREVEALRADATVCEDVTLDCFRRMVASARIWWYTGFEDNGVPVFKHDPPRGDLHIPSVDLVTSIVAEAVTTGKKLELVVLNTSHTLELGLALWETARVPFVVCWDGFVHDRAAFAFGMALAAAVKAGQAPEDAFRHACSKVESMSNKKGKVFRLQKVDDSVAGSAVHGRDDIVPVGLPKLFQPPSAPLVRIAELTGTQDSAVQRGIKRTRSGESTSGGS